MKAVKRTGGKAVRVLAWTACLTALPAYRLTGQETSLTVYADGRLLVRRTIPGAIARGDGVFGADLGVREVEAGSIVSLDTTVQVTGMRVFGSTGPEGSLRRMIGHEVTFRVVGADSAVRYVRGILLSVDPPAVRIDGYVMYGFPGTPVFPDSMVQLNPRYEISVEARVPANGLRLMYMSNGLSWSASYAVLLPRGGAGRAIVGGNAEIRNEGAIALTGTQVQLLAGTVRRVAPPRPMAMARRSEMNAQAGFINTADGPGEEGLSGTHVYTLPGTVDFAPGENRVLALFPRVTASVEPELVLRGQNYGVTNQWPDAQRDLHPEIGYRVNRAASSAFGSRPLPAGTVRVFEPDSSGRPQLVGEVPIDHTPEGRDLRLTTGTAFDVTATRTQTAFEQRGERESISAYRVELHNAKPQAVTVLVTDMCPGRCEVLSSTRPSEQSSANTVGFKVTVPANGDAVLEYRLRARW